MKTDNEFITKQILVDLNELIGIDLEGFLNLLEERCGASVLEDISYSVVGALEGDIVIEVSGRKVAL